MAKKKHTHNPSPVVAMILAWILPGAGHFYIGRRARGLVILLTISATFWAGVAIGGIMTVDADNEGWWFASEMLTGVNGVTAWRFSERELQELTTPDWPQPPLMDPALYHQLVADQQMAPKDVALSGQVATVARAYSGIAGLLNLLCIFDAAMLAMMGAAAEPQPPTKEPEPAEAAKA